MSDCAYYMGLSAEWIRSAIQTGVTVGGRTVKLEAETITHVRRTYRIHEHHFVAFLQAIGWKHLPPDGATVSAPLRVGPHAVSR